MLSAARDQAAHAMSLAQAGFRTNCEARWIAIQATSNVTPVRINAFGCSLESEDRHRKPQQREPDDGHRQGFGDDNSAAHVAMLTKASEPRIQAPRHQHREQQRQSDEAGLHRVSEHEDVSEQPPVDGIPDRQQAICRE